VCKLPALTLVHVVSVPTGVGVLRSVVVPLPTWPHVFCPQHHNACDVVMALPASADVALATRPYYRSAYALVSSRQVRPVRSLDDPRLVRALLIGVDAGAPPAAALAERGVPRFVRTATGPGSPGSPPARIWPDDVAGRCGPAVDRARAARI